MRALRVTAVVAAALWLVGCKAASNNTAPAAQVAPGDAAQHAVDQVAVLFKDVTTVSYDAGKATQCTVLYNVYNNTGLHLYHVTTAAGDYIVPISELSANSHYAEDETMTVDPVNGSCAGVANKLIQTGSHVSTTACRMEKLTEGDCQAKVVGYVAVDTSTLARLQKEDQTATQAVADQQQQAFQQAKAQAWAQRGQYEAPVGTAYNLTNSSNPAQLAVVLEPDFDPTKVDPTTQIATSNVTFCAADPTTGVAPAGTLTIQSIARDQYGLASWLRMKMDCPGSRPQRVWLRADGVVSMLQSGQLAKAG